MESMGNLVKELRSRGYVATLESFQPGEDAREVGFAMRGR